MTPYSRDSQLLVLSILRCYNPKTGELWGEKPLDFPQTVNLLAQYPDMGAKQISNLLLQAPEITTGRDMLGLVPSDCRNFLNEAADLHRYILTLKREAKIRDNSERLEKRVKMLEENEKEFQSYVEKVYPEAYDEFLKWRKDPSSGYFKDELTPENLARIEPSAYKYKHSFCGEFRKVIRQAVADGALSAPALAKEMTNAQTTAGTAFPPDADKSKIIDLMPLLEKPSSQIQR